MSKDSDTNACDFDCMPHTCSIDRSKLHIGTRARALKLLKAKGHANGVILLEVQISTKSSHHLFRPVPTPVIWLNREGRLSTCMTRTVKVSSGELWVQLY